MTAYQCTLMALGYTWLLACILLLIWLGLPIESLIQRSQLLPHLGSVGGVSHCYLLLSGCARVVVLSPLYCPMLRLSTPNLMMPRTPSPISSRMQASSQV